MPKAPQWETTPMEEDYQAATRYLSLLLPPERAAILARSLKGSGLMLHRANDLLRASELPLLPADDPEVAKDLKKVKKGKKLSPVLLVRGDLGQACLTVADGYHRICASYHLNPDSPVPCRTVDLARETLGDWAALPEASLSEVPAGY